MPLLKKFLWRTSKISVKEEISLPPQVQETIYLNFSEIEAYNYNQSHERCKDFIQAGNISAGIINSMVLQLRQTW